MKRLDFVLAPRESRGGFRSNPPPAARRGLRLGRDGATLSEILIAILVMGIGVVSLATLFPISVLRSIQATQLTNSTIHRLNAQNLIELYPRLIHDPDNNKPAVFVDYSYLREHNSQKFVVDPLGATNANLIATGAGFIDSFGNDANTPFPATTRLTRYNGGFATTGGVYSVNPNVAYLPDSWHLAAEGFLPTRLSATQISVPATVDLLTAYDTLTALGTGSVRIVLFSADGKGSVTRDVTVIDNTTKEITWTGDLPNATAYNTTLARYRLEFVDLRYSWILTVRKKPNALFPAGDAEVDVVVFHKRDFSVASEQAFELAANVAVGDTVITLDLTNTNALGLVPPLKPFLKRGGFVFDATNAQWYRIVQVKEDAVNPVVEIDRAAIAPIQAGNVNGPDIMTMTGVVEVFPLGTISYDPNNAP